MGFGVSGSFVILLAGALIAFGTFYGAAWNSMERINDARAAQTEHRTTVQETLVRVHGVDVINASDCDVEFNATNTGERALDVEAVDLLVDNSYETNWRDNATVEGAETTIWHPGDRLAIELFELGTGLDRIKLVTGSGVADAREVSASC